MSVMSPHIRAFTHLGNACGAIGRDLPPSEAAVTMLSLGNALLEAAKTIKTEEGAALDAMAPKHDKPTSQPARKS